MTVKVNGGWGAGEKKTIAWNLRRVTHEPGGFEIYGGGEKHAP